MRSNSILTLTVLAAATSPSAGQVSLSYAPTTLDPGIPTVFTISVTDESGERFPLDYAGFEFHVPEGLAIRDFEWLDEFGDPESYIFLAVLPNLAQTVSRLGSPPVFIGPGETRDLAILMLTADESAAGSILTLTVMPESAKGAFIVGDGAITLDITDGRSVDLEINEAPAIETVSFSYAPTTLDPDVPTRITIRVTDESSRVITLGRVGFVFETSAGLAISDLEWLDELGDPADYDSLINLPDTAQTSFRPGGSQASIAAGATRAIAILTVAADPMAEDSIQTLTLMPESAPNALITNGDDVELNIAAGRSVDLEITEAPAIDVLSISYSPTTLDPDVPTRITFSATDESGRGVTLGHIGFVFDTTDGLAISNLQWLGELGDPTDYTSLIDLPNSGQTSYRPGGSRAHIRAGATRDIATLTVTADTMAADSIQTLTLMPELTTDALITNGDDVEVEITSGRSVDLEINELPLGDMVSFSYAPTTLDPGVPTDLTISVNDESGLGFAIAYTGFHFEVPVGITISDFEWLAELADREFYLFLTGLPALAQTVNFDISGQLGIGPGENRDIAVLTVTAAPHTDGSVLTLGVMPESEEDAIILGGRYNLLEITAGRRVDLQVTGISTIVREDEDQDSDDDEASLDGDDDAEQAPGAASEDEEELVETDATGSESNDEFDRLETELDDVLTNDADQDESADRTAEADGSDLSAGAPTPSPPLFPFCGLGLIPFLLFTLTCLSVMKARRRRRPCDHQTIVEAGHEYLHTILSVPGEQAGVTVSSMSSAGGGQG